MTYRRLLEEAERVLAAGRITEPGENAWQLFEFVFEMDRVRYFLRRDEEAPEDLCRRYARLIEERKKHIPLQYLIGYCWFMGLKFWVDERVLIPRQDTETLVEEFLKDIEGRPGEDWQILDLCAGSGCIGLSAAWHLRQKGRSARLTEADLSEDALAVVKKNAADQGTGCERVRTDLFSGLSGRRFDYILSNPPYIASAEVETLMEEVRDYEPGMALNGGADGLDFYRRIAAESADHLTEDGRLFLEIGYDQGEAVKGLLEAEGFREVRVIRDLAGNPRVVRAIRKQEGGIPHV
jgi:release factor glutamine methyltransferase